MPQTFTCKNSKCNKTSAVRGIQQSDGIQFVVCEYCGAKNKLMALPRKEGAPIEFEVISLVDHPA
jgi:transcription elongation factor Elf1